MDCEFVSSVFGCGFSVSLFRVSQYNLCRLCREERCAFRSGCPKSNAILAVMAGVRGA